MMYEIWPGTLTARQLWCIVGLQWPDLTLGTDRPPSFIDPNLFVTGATADVLRIKNLRDYNSKDPFWDMNLAREYEALFQMQLQQNISADESKAMRNYQYARSEIYGSRGANYWQSHSADVDAWTV